jgi:sterol desaturase/sphingolipid hydroxylase (fatty acid hydroxylase superfamily)
MTCFNELVFTAAAAWPFIWFMDLMRYLAGAGLMVAVLDLASGGWLRRRLVRIRAVAEGQQGREFLRSMRTVLVFSLVGTGVWVGYLLGVSRLYFVPEAYGWGWLVASFPVMVVLHDAWFYWTHRLMHHPRGGPLAHRTHHLSSAPTPWTAYSFSAAEATVQALYLPVVLLFVPIHQAVVFLWMVYMVLRNVMGHSGTELLPRGWLAGGWGRCFTTTLHHEMHHAYGRYNYGLYFTWWDRWCGTEHPEYRQRLQALVASLAAAGTAAPGGAAWRTSPSGAQCSSLQKQ